jgi:hypothetical protein
VYREGGQQGRSGRERAQDGRVVEAAVRADPGQAVDDRGQCGRQQRQAEDVQPLPVRRRVRREAAPGEDEREDADGHVDVEDPPPADVADDQPADDRAEDRPDQGGQADDRQQAPETPPAGRAHQHGLQDRHDQPAADALDHPEGDQGTRVPRDAAQHRSGQEHQQRDQPHAPRAEPFRRPGGHRDRHAERQQVTGDHPLHGRHRGVQVAPQRVEGDVDDHAVQQWRHRADDQNPGKLEQRRIEPIRWTRDGHESTSRRIRDESSLSPQSRVARQETQRL